MNNITNMSVFQKVIRRLISEKIKNNHVVKSGNVLEKFIREMFLRNKFLLCYQLAIKVICI